MILGIDVGINGGYALVNDNKELIECGKLPFKVKRFKQKRYKKIQDIEKIRELFISLKKAFNISTAIIENVHPMPGQGLCSTGSFLKAAGVIEGLLEGLGFEVIKVSPRVWKKVLGVSNDKKKSKALAEALFKTVFPSHDVAEAALLTLYAKMLKEGGKI